MAETAQTQTAPKESEIAKQIRKQEEQSVFDYLQSLASADVPIKVTVRRLRPKEYKGVNIGGVLSTFDYPISEEDVQDHYGGGTYKLTIQTAEGDNGSYRIKTHRNVEIAGPPKMDMYDVPSESRVEDRGPHGSPDVVMAAMRTSAEIAERAERARLRAEDLSRQTRDDPATRMALDEVRALREESAAKDERMFQMIREQNNGSSAIEQLLSKMLDGESSRVAMLRQQVDSELRMKADMHRAEIDRLHARFEDAVKRQEDQHRREIDNLQRAHDLVLQTTKMSHEAQTEGYKRELDFVSRQLGAVQAEVAELRVKKDKGPVETLTELAALKEAMDTFSVGDSEGTLDKIIGAVGPLAEGVATRLAGAAPAGAEVPMQNPAPTAGSAIDRGIPPDIVAAMPIDQPVQLPDGRVMVKRANGQLVAVNVKKKSEVPEGDVPTVPDGEILAVLPYMESALAADRDPKVFANTARTLVPTLVSGPIGQLITKGGVDALLDRVAQLRPESPLLSQHGKNWVRKVAETLTS